MNNRTANITGESHSDRAPVKYERLPKGISVSELMSMRETGMTNNAIATAINTTTACVKKLIGDTPDMIVTSARDNALKKARAERVVKQAPPKELGERLRELRNANGFSTADVAKYIDISQSNISYYENGKTAPSLSTLIKIAAMYDVSADYLLGTTNSKRNVVFTGAYKNEPTSKPTKLMEQYAQKIDLLEEQIKERTYEDFILGMKNEIREDLHDCELLYRERVTMIKVLQDLKDMQ